MSPASLAAAAAAALELPLEDIRRIICVIESIGPDEGELGPGEFENVAEWRCDLDGRRPGALEDAVELRGVSRCADA